MTDVRSKFKIWIKVFKKNKRLLFFQINEL